jgi:2-phospho-L-lactate guanylyltransferase
VRTHAVLPVKRFSQAKQRLRAAVDGEPRERLAAAMVGDVLAVLSRTEALDAVIMVTAEARAAELARVCGARVVADGVEAGQSAAALMGIKAALDDGAERVLLVPGDTPALQPADLVALLAREEPVVVVPDRHGSGTNALLLAPPDAIAPAFGPGSRERHEAAARAAGHAHAVLQLRSLALDIDTPDDLEALRATRAPGPRTRALL